MKRYTKKIRNGKRKTYKKKIRNGKRKTQRGGLFGLFKSKDTKIIENYDKTKCPGAEQSCDFFDTQFSNKLNPTWNTCININGINNHILYITQTNVIIKSIESLQIPQFMVKLGNNSESPISCKIMIEDKFISCFLLVCNEWYVIMRLFGKTLNRGYFARTEKNRVFYKLKNIKIDASDPTFGKGSGVMTFPTICFTELNNSYKFTTDSMSKQIKLKEEYFTNIDKTNSPQVFKVLQRFRQQKLFANYEKQAAAQDAASYALDQVGIRPPPLFAIGAPAAAVAAAPVMDAPVMDAFDIDV